MFALSSCACRLVVWTRRLDSLRDFVGCVDFNSCRLISLPITAGVWPDSLLLGAAGSLGGGLGSAAVRPSQHPRPAHGAQSGLKSHLAGVLHAHPAKHCSPACQPPSRVGLALCRSGPHAKITHVSACHTTGGCHCHRRHRHSSFWWAAGLARHSAW